LDLPLAQNLFNKPNQLSRIEAIECTQEECERTGLQSDTVLANELARITDQAVLLRREQMANARSSIRSLNHANSVVIQNMLWIMLTLTILAMTFWNTLQRRNEMGVFQAIGYGSTQLLTLLVGRSVFLTSLGALLGGAIGSWLSYAYCQNAFEETGSRFAIDWSQPWIILLVSIVLAGLAACLPALISATRLPADSIGKES
jgi:ABC-type antimicrobial peptide transport system permease subunit